MPRRKTRRRRRRVWWRWVLRISLKLGTGRSCSKICEDENLVGDAVALLPQTHYFTAGLRDPKLQERERQKGRAREFWAAALFAFCARIWCLRDAFLHHLLPRVRKYDVPCIHSLIISCQKYDAKLRGRKRQKGRAREMMGRCAFCSLCSDMVPSAMHSLIISCRE